jgi:hypothetical protein
MKCLSLWQPWASLLVSGLKKVETRKRTSEVTRHRGPLLIHAAKKWDVELALICTREPFRSVLAKIGIKLTPNEEDAKLGWGLPFGSIVGSVVVLDSRRTDDCTIDRSRDRSRLFKRAASIGRSDLEFGDFRPDRVAMFCGDAKTFQRPIPYIGLPFIFDVPDEIIREALVS